MCQLAIVGKGPVLDQELAVLKIDDDVDLVAGELLRLLGLPTPPPYNHATDPLLSAAEEPFEGEPSAPWRIGAIQRACMAVSNNENSQYPVRCCLQA